MYKKTIFIYIIYTHLCVLFYFLVENVDIDCIEYLSLL